MTPEAIMTRRENQLRRIRNAYDSAMRKVRRQRSTITKLRAEIVKQTLRADKFERQSAHVSSELADLKSKVIAQAYRSTSQTVANPYAIPTHATLIRRSKMDEPWSEQVWKPETDSPKSLREAQQ